MSWGKMYSNFHSKQGSEFDCSWVLAKISNPHEQVACVPSDKSFDPVGALNSNDLKNYRGAECGSSGNSDNHLAEQVHVTL